MKKIKTIIFILFCALVLTSCELNHAGATKHPDNDIINPEVATYTLTLKDYTSNDVIKTITKNVDKVISSSELTFLDKTGFKTVLLNEEEDTIKISDITSTSTVFVKYIPNTYKFVYHESSTKTILDINYEETITSISPKNTPTGKEFLGWSSSSTEFIPYEFTTMPACNVEVYAFYKDKIYNIVLNTNLDIFSGIENVSKYNYGDRLVNIVPQELLDAINATSDYEFAGWYFDQECTKKFNLISMPSHDINLYAKWIYRGLAYYNDSSLIIESTQNIGDEIITPTAPSKPGYIFENWYYDLEYTNVVKPGDIITSDLKAIYAKYTPETNKEYKVEYYQQTLHGAYKLQESVTLTGYTDEEVHVEIKSYNGFTFNSNDSRNILKGNVKHDSVIVLKAYYTRNTYKLTIDSLNDTTPIKYDLLFEEAIPTISTPTKAGHTFNGWNTSVPTTMPAENVELTAIWTINQYTISFNSNGGTEVQSITQDYGTVVTIPEEPTKVGHTFNGWNTLVPTKMPATNVELSAIWTINQYTISFNSNGGTEVQSITQDYGTVVTIPENPTRVGYTFVNWDKEIPTTMPAENVELTAIWTVNKYTISFDTNGGTEVQSITQDYGTAVNAPEDPTKVGHTFNGWSTAVPTTMPSQNVILTAIWTVNKYTISFNSNGGTEVQSITQDYGTVVNAPEEPTKVGHTFNGWNATIPTTMPAENVELTAIWTINQYTISFDTDGGTEVQSITQDYGTVVTIQENPTKVGHTFNGWSSAVPTTMPSQNVILTAIWTVNKYTISFDTNGGTEVQSITQDYGTVVTIPENPTKVGHTFVNWDKEIPTIIPAENVELTAIWTINQYTISFDTDGGTEVQSITQDYGTVVTIPENPTKVGHTFNGWSSAVPTTMPSQNVILTAIWTVNKYTISFNSNGGTEVQSITQDYGTVVTIPEEPTKVGHTFNGWNATIPTTMPAENVELTAIWTINQYTISFDTDGGTEVQSITQDYGTVVTIPENPTKVGHTFNGWSSAVPTTMPSQNVILTAIWTVNKYTISFDTNGGTEVQSITQDYGTAVTIPENPTKVGHTFVNWDKEIPTTMPDYDVLITAIWQELPKYTISFVLDSSIIGTVDNITNYAGVEITLPNGDNLTHPKGLVLDGWSLSEGGEVVNYTVMPSNNVTLYPKWRADSFIKVTSNLEDWSGLYLIVYEQDEKSYIFNGSLNTLDVAYNSTLFTGINNIPYEISNDYLFTINKEDNNGYTIQSKSGYYIGRTTSSNGLSLSKTYKYYHNLSIGTENDETFVIIDSKNSSYLRFNATSNQMRFRYYGSGQKGIQLYRLDLAYNITFNSNDTLNNEKSLIVFDSHNFVTLNNDAFTRENYKLIGWSTNSNATTAEFGLNETITATDNVTLYAVWQENPKYTITFNTDGGSIVESITKYENEVISLPSTSKEGYDFLGWSIDNNNTVEYHAGENYNVTNNSTLYAVFEYIPVNERTITFNTKGGTSVTAIDGLIGETITLPTSNKLFSRLIGWSTEDDNTAEFTVNASYEIVDNVTLYAVWEERPTIEKEIYSDGFEGYTTSSTYTYNNTEFISTTGNVNYSWDIRMGTVSTSDALDGNNSLHFRAYNGNSTYGAAYTNFKLSNITKIEFDAKYASQKCSLKVLVSEDKMNWTEVSSFELTNSKTHYSASVPSSIGFGKDLHIKYEVVYSSVPQGTYKVIIDNFSVEGLVERVSVTYQANDGTNNSIIENAAYGTYTTKPNTAFTREGYQLIGWATSNNATTAEYDCNSELNLTNDITLYAVWEEIPTYTITFNTDGSSVNSITKNENEEITLPSTSKDGYTFLGWSDQDDNSVEYSAGAKYTVTQNATLYAVWREVANITSDSFVFSDLSLPDVKDNQRVWTVGNATFVQDKFEGQSGISNNIPIRIYAGHSVTISSQYAFTSLVFTCSSNSYATALINSIGNAYTVTKNENVVTVTFNTAVTTFTFKCSEQVRLSSLVVNY